MATNTPNLNLLKKDPVTDGNETFNIQTMLNDNWDKIDAAVGEIDIPDASLTVKGKVQLSNETDSDAEDRAATPKAVSGVALQAKSYTDQQIGLVTETGIPKLVSYPLLVTATTDNQTEFEIPLDLFDANADTLLVSINRATLDSTRYIVTNTVRDGSGQVMQRAKITLLTGVIAGSKISMVVLKNVPIGPEGAINGAVLAVDSVPINRVNGLQERLDAQLDDLASNASGKGASLIGVEDAEGHFTGETMEAVLAELFTFANDGKTGLASVIGSPATAADSFGTLNGLVQTDKNTLASNLTAKGVSAAGTETLAGLVGKVANVPTSTFKSYTGTDLRQVGVPGGSITSCPIPTGFSRVDACRVVAGNNATVHLVMYRTNLTSGAMIETLDPSYSMIQGMSSNATTLLVTNKYQYSQDIIFNYIIGV